MKKGEELFFRFMWFSTKNNIGKDNCNCQKESSCISFINKFIQLINSHDDLLTLLLAGRASKPFINKQKDKSYGQKTSPDITFIDKLIQFVKRHDDLLSKAMDKDKNSIVPNTLTVKSNREEDGNTVMKNAADRLVENAEYTLKASFETIISLIKYRLSEVKNSVNRNE